MSEAQTPDGWRRETRITGTNHWEDDLAGGYYCPDCDHYIPIDQAEAAECPVCEKRGLIGTIISGTQEATYLLRSEE